MSPNITIIETVIIATRASGIFFVILGKTNIISIVKPTNANILYIAVPTSQFSPDLNIPS